MRYIRITTIYMWAIQRQTVAIKLCSIDFAIVWLQPTNKNQIVVGKEFSMRTVAIKGMLLFYDMILLCKEDNFIRNLIKNVSIKEIMKKENYIIAHSFVFLIYWKQCSTRQ